jgi:Type II CAAX prenyl endopeptidase Rce1-like
MKIFSAQLGILLLFSMTGIAAEMLWGFEAFQQELHKSNVPLPPLWLLLTGVLVKNLFFMVIPISIGIICTRSLDLHSYTIDRLVFHQALKITWQEVCWSLGLGISLTIVVLLLDQSIQPYLPQSFSTGVSTQPVAPWWLGVLSGGVLEEIIMRWGAMSFLVWLGWKIFKQGVALPSQWIYQLAILLSALLFSLLHLPATAAITSLTPALIGRAIVGNGILGIAYGWLFWQYSLEAAIIAHACFHLVILGVSKISIL